MSNPPEPTLEEQRQQLAELEAACNAAAAESAEGERRLDAAHRHETVVRQRHYALRERIDKREREAKPLTAPHSTLQA